ncbi:MAG: hypothetical protein AB4290_28295 [Spirulina sp.]
MSNSSTSPAKPRRFNIPFLLDLVIVSDPEQIKKIETSGAVDRVHAYETTDLPWWVKLYFKSTKFHDDKRDLWFLPFEKVSNSTYQKRRDYLHEQVATGYSKEDIKNIAELLNQDTSDETLAHAMVQIVNHRFFEKEVPQNITKTSKDTVQSIGEAICPWKYIKGRQSQQKIMDYCEQNLPKDVHILDVGHNIGEVVQATAGALRTLKENLDKPVEEIFTLNAPTPQVLRIAVQESTFDGLLSSPITPQKTMLILKIGEAAATTKDISFTFGTGRAERACVFQEFFLAFMKDLQEELKS